MINNLKPPFQIISGVVCDTNGKELLYANRQSGTTPLQPVERDQLIKLVSDLLNREYPILKESLNEAQLGDKVSLKGERGDIIGQTSDGKWIIQIQGSTKTATDKEVKVLRGLAQNVKVKPHMRFDDKTQKLLFEQFIKCGIYYNAVPIKMSDCYVRYSDYMKEGSTVNVLIEGALNIMPKEQIRILEDPNSFANPQDYVPGVIISPDTEEVMENILLHAGDYSSALGDADPVRIISDPNTEEASLGTIPKGSIRTLSV